MRTAEQIGKSEKPVEIYTLGRFLIKSAEIRVTDRSNRSRKLWELFKLLIIHREKPLLPEVILDTLWPDQDYSDAGLAVRSLVFRLRHTLSEELPDALLAAGITFYQGGYRWSKSPDCWLDAEQFESGCTQARMISDAQPEQAIVLYQESLALYQGEFLPECLYHEWVIPVRTYYQRLFLQSVFHLIDLLKKMHRYQEIIEICERALVVEYYEEDLHIRYLEALLEEGKLKQALAHYDTVTIAFFREMGIKPSPELNGLYRRMQCEDAEGFELDVTLLQEGLSGRREVKGAYSCNPEMFRYFYKLERNRCQRSGYPVVLALFALTRPDDSLPPPEVLHPLMEQLQESLFKNLRKGDIVCRWNEAQFLLLLPGLKVAQSNAVLKRIEQSFGDGYKQENITIHKKAEDILPPES